MKRRLTNIFGGDGLRARAARGGVLVFSGFAGQNILRLIGNLVLTRVLFPEAFGLMALVQVLMVGLAMFSDIGLHTSIMQNKRGEDPDFLNTAWTMQIIRGAILWLAACLLARPLAIFYEAPQLAELVPVAALAALINGFQTTNIATANRNIVLGRLTALNLGVQGAGLIATVVLAVLLQSVWALVLGNLLSSILKVGLAHSLMPGIRNKVMWERTAVAELFGFGKYLFVGTLAGFLVSNADRAILGKYISLADLAIYNIAFFLASVPFMLSQQLVNKILFPLYRERPPAASEDNRARIARTRFLLSGGLVGLAFILSLSGDFMIRFLYDQRYYDAGPVMVLLALALVPSIITNSYGSLLLAEGDSRGFSIIMIVSSVVRTLLLFVFIQRFGLIGVIYGLFLSPFVTYPVIVNFARKTGGWDWRHDLVYILTLIAMAIPVFIVNKEVILKLLSQSG